MFRQTAQASHLTGSCRVNTAKLNSDSDSVFVIGYDVKNVVRPAAYADGTFLLSTQREKVSVLSGHRPMMQITMRSVSLMQGVITTARQLCHIQLLTMK